MKPKILNDDGNYDEWCEAELLKAFKDAAEYDDFMFGDFDWNEYWANQKTNDVY